VSVEHSLRQIASDNRSGAAELLARAVEVFDDLEAESKFATTAEARTAVIEAAVSLVNLQPCMGTLINLAGAVIRAAGSASCSDELVKACAKASNQFRDACRFAVFAAAREMARFVGDGKTILTHSRSSTILGALSGARSAGKNFRVIVTESRPMAEGRTLATELAGEDIRVTLIADAAAASAMGEVGYVFVGADLITSRAVVNKIGTRMIALAARERSIPMYAVADFSKFINTPTCDLPPEPRREPDELWTGAPLNVVVMNRYFEETPLDYFTGIITEEGLLSPDAVRRRTEAAILDASLFNALRDNV
jgi:translation initiation factor 2B subunit (eIF-2B alpha/beta/delta family)